MKRSDLPDFEPHASPVFEAVEDETVDFNDKSLSSVTDLSPLLQKAIDELNVLFPLGNLEEAIKTTASFSLDTAGYLSTLNDSVNNESSTRSLNWLHVESLVDQASDLLDRATVTRQQFDDTSSKMFLQLLELKEYVELDKVHKEEEAAGAYEVNFKRSASDLASEQTAKDGYSALAKRYANLATVLFRPGATWDELRQEVIRGSQINGLLAYEFSGQTLSKYVDHDIEGKNQTVSSHSRDASIAQLMHSGSLQYESLINQSVAMISSQKISEKRLDGLSSYKDWASKNRGFQIRRTAIARQFENLKLNAATAADGVLNHSKRLPGLRSRFDEDVKSALLKLQAARIGLNRVFGYDLAFPDFASEDSLDGLIQWCRTVIQWLIANSQFDLSSAFPLSLRDLVGEDDWVKGAVNGEWTFQLSPEDIDNRLSLVRFRGISMTIVPRTDIVRKCDTGRRLYRFVVSPPKTAHAVRDDGSVATVEQPHLPSLVFARVNDRWNHREPDILGASSLHNSSPFGEWKVTLAGGIPKDGIRADLLVDLADIHLDFYLAYRVQN